ncbi:hypothetical protein RC62_3002 [Flavobacterium aquidurense]|uniref:Uncharacterized protein n=1 Tax=Flavobacterium aquidurense TaxID=362413 RepID=A0A0N8VLY7_9FLAO|nr:hypothetical protein RC62_3002 [Flavobacterium aquidurense]
MAQKINPRKPVKSVKSLGKKYTDKTKWFYIFEIRIIFALFAK